MKVAQTVMFMDRILLTPMKELVYLSAPPYGATASSVRTERKATGERFAVPTFELSKKGKWMSDRTAALRVYRREVVAGLTKKLAAAGCVKASIFWKLQPGMIQSNVHNDSILFCEVGAAGWKPKRKGESCRR